MTSRKELLNEIASETAKTVVELFNWDREEQMAEAFQEVFRVVQEYLERFVLKQGDAFKRFIYPNEN